MSETQQPADICLDDNSGLDDNGGLSTTYTAQANSQSTVNQMDTSLLVSTQLPPNQQLYADLDVVLQNLTRDLFIDKLIEETHADYNSISWYRRVLSDRARTIDTCPKTDLKGRKTTNKSTSARKLAVDCYVLKQFVNGDSSEIESVYMQEKKHTPSESDTLPVSTIRSDMASMQAMLHAAITRITALETSETNYKKEIAERDKQLTEINDKFKTMHEQISSVSNRCQSLYRDVNKINEEQLAKFALYDSFKKLTTQKLATIENFDNNVNEKRLHMISDSISAVSAQITNCNKHILSVKSFASCVSTNETISARTASAPGTIIIVDKPPTPTSTKTVIGNTHTSASPQAATLQYTGRNNATADHMEKLRSMADSVNTLEPDYIARKHAAPASLFDKRNETVRDETPNPQHNKRTPMANNHPPHQNEAIDLTATRDNTTTNSAPKQPRQTNSTKDNSSTDNTFIGAVRHDNRSKNTRQENNYRNTTKSDNTFIGVSRKNTKRFYIGNIDKRSTYGGILNFFEQQGFTPSMVSMFRTRSGEFAARVNVPTNEAEYMTSDDTSWPDGVIVKPWMTRTEISKQRQERNSARQSRNTTRRGYGRYSDDTHVSNEYDNYEHGTAHDEHDANTLMQITSDNRSKRSVTFERDNSDYDNTRTDWYDYDN
ncbi:MAG: hypothetical protein ABW185_27775 [Sedimenticola sp.]